MATSAERPHDLLIKKACLADAEGNIDLAIRDGVIAALAPNISEPATETIDAAGGLVTCSFVEPHFHLDKCLSRPLVGAITPEEAFARAHEAKIHFTVADVEARASEALRLAVAQGIGHMRAQCDVDYATKLISFEGLLRARERFADAIDLEIVAFPQEGMVKDAEAPGLLREALAGGADAVGGLPEAELNVDDQRRHVALVLDIAAETGVPVEMHCDYMDHAELKTLAMLAAGTLERGLQGRVTASHCNALANYSDDEAKAVIEQVKQAGISVAVLPVANLQMLGGPKRTPYNRGSSRVKELLDAGINVAAGSDSMFDIWYRFNRLDPVETGYIACLSAGMRTDEEVQTAFDMVTARAARMVGKAAAISVGAPADLVVHGVSNIVQVLRNLPGRRLHIKNGRVVGGQDSSNWCIR
ncbi:MAG: amidohydrolase family protein [Rhodospirillaceae bacterium]|nr:amidohydrolase family protein [Rhodospirillaceae bacterium]